jgi:hypothetical protein
MAFEALKALHGRSLHSEPLDKCTWAETREEINRAHIWQYGAPHVRHLAGLLLSFGFQPTTVFDRVASEIARHGACIVNMFDIGAWKGHSVLAYSAVRYAPGQYYYGQIWVADSEKPWTGKAHESVINIATNQTWTGCSGYGCNWWAFPLIPSTILYYSPMHVMSILPWTPFADLFVFGLSVLFVLGGAAEAQQVRVGEQEMYDEERGVFVQNGIPNMTILPASTDGPAPFIVAGRDPLTKDLQVRLAGKEAGEYQALFKSSRSAVRLASPTQAAAEDTLTLSAAAGKIRKVALQTSLEHTVRRLEVETLDGPVDGDRTVFRLDLPLARDQVATTEIDPQSGALLLSGPEPSGQVSGEMVRVIDGKSHSKTLQDLMRPTQDEVVRLRVLDRSILDSPVMVERLSKTRAILEQRIY